MLDDVYREIIVDHNDNPRNKRPLPNATAKARGYNPICGDDVTVFVRLENGAVAEATFTGQSCAICQASASMLTEAVAQQPMAAVAPLIARVKSLLMGEIDEAEDLGEIEALKGVRRLPLRVKCATLSWNALESALASAT